jgi:hypothetical protein
MHDGEEAAEAMITRNYVEYLYLTVVHNESIFYSEMIELKIIKINFRAF